MVAAEQPLMQPRISASHPAIIHAYPSPRQQHTGATPMPPLPGAVLLEPWTDWHCPNCWASGHGIE